MFSTKEKILKKLTQEEIIKLLDTKKLTIKELINIKQQIITELENRSNNELEISKEYKSFTTKDFSLTQNNKTINFIIEEDGLLLGTDAMLNFYIGKVNNNLHIILFEFGKLYTHLVFRGKFDSNYRYYYGAYWHDETETANAHNKFDFLSCDDSVYNDIIDQKIPGIKTQVQLSYQEQCKNKNVDTILSILKNNNINKAKILKKQL